jgi:hypothetical protein
MSVLTNVARVIIVGVGNALTEVGKDLINAISSQCYVVVKESETSFAEFFRHLDLFSWVSGWDDIWSDIVPIFFSELLAPVWGNRALKVCVWNLTIVHGPRE